MSVYVSKRNQAKPEFLMIAQDLLIFTIKNVRRFPKSYHYPLTNDLLKLANEIHEYALKANAIYVHKNMTEEDFKLRERYITLAKSSLVALSGKLTVTFKLVNEGNNFFENKADYSYMFQKWVDLVNSELDKLKGLTESDRKRWKSYQKSKN